MASQKLISTSQVLDREGVATLLTQLAERIRTGQVILSRGEESLTVDLPASMKVDVDVVKARKRARTKMELEIEIEWYEGVDAQPKTLTLG